MNTQYLFQYCQKIVLFSKDKTSVLFALRQGEADYDGTWSLIGGKMEVTDSDNLAALKREKDEEVGAGLAVDIAPMYSCFTVTFRKKDGSHMILPHVVAVHVDGEIVLNHDEYTQARWLPISELPTFGPKIDNTVQVVANARKLLDVLGEQDFTRI